MANRTVVLAVVAVAVIGGAVWFLYFQDEAPPPRVAAPAKPPVAAPKPAAPTPPVAAAPSADAAKPAPAAPPSNDPAAVDKAVKATQSRVGELEKTAADLRNQIAQKDKEIAAMEKKLAAKK